MPSRAAGPLVLVLLSVFSLGAVCEENGQHRLEPGDNTRQIGALLYSDKGTQDVRGATVQRIVMENFAFSPTFLRGNPGQTITLALENKSSQATHNFSLTAQGITQDVTVNNSVELQVTFPQSGTVMFLCKLHSSQGMNGQLLVGDATPSAGP